MTLEDILKRYKIHNITIKYVINKNGEKVEMEVPAEKIIVENGIIIYTDDDGNKWYSDGGD